MFCMFCFCSCSGINIIFGWCNNELSNKYFYRFRFTSILVIMMIIKRTKNNCIDNSWWYKWFIYLLLLTQVRLEEYLKCIFQLLSPDIFGSKSFTMRSAFQHGIRGRRGGVSYLIQKSIVSDCIYIQGLQFLKIIQDFHN